MRYLIDGYNLLHTLGYLPPRSAPGRLEQARQALVRQLSHHPRLAPGQITVVFDARGAPPRAEAEQYVQGIHLLFALREEADDVIEDLIAAEPAPQQLTVVSDDRRLQQAARRGHCQALGCVDFLEVLQQAEVQAPPRASTPPTKPERPSREEMQHWLQEFADLVEDPRVNRELNWGFPDEEDLLGEEGG
jgi:predicted RNA-binding protein with PIN domain